jgi:Nuclease-related domain
MRQSYPQRASRRYRLRAWTAFAAAAIALLGMGGARSSFAASATMLVVAGAAVGLGIMWRRRAARYRAGARSERLVAERLQPLAQHGWTVRHSVAWPGRGDIDHVVEAPSGLAFAIETKTGRYDRAHLARTCEAALQLDPQGRSCVPVLCLVRRKRVSLAEDGVHVVSADLLPEVLAELAGQS